MAKTIQQKFLNFCKKFGRLEISGKTMQCYIPTENILKNVGDFTIELNELSRNFTEKWVVWVRPQEPDIVIEFDKYFGDKNVGMELSVNLDAEVLIAMDSELLRIQGRKGEKRGCTLMIDRVTKGVAVTCFGTFDTHDPTVSSISARAKV